MQTKVIIRASAHHVPEAQINKAVEELGEGWHIVTANTAVAAKSTGRSTDAAEMVFVTTVLVQKD